MKAIFAPELNRVKQGSAPSTALWEELLRSVITRNAHCSSFILTNYINGASLNVYPTVRDMLDTLEGLMEVKKIIYCIFVSVSCMKLCSFIRSL